MQTNLILELNGIIKTGKSVQGKLSIKFINKRMGWYNGKV